jgi:hypothetical protein
MMSYSKLPGLGERFVRLIGERGPRQRARGLGSREPTSRVGVSAQFGSGPV